MKTFKNLSYLRKIGATLLLAISLTSSYAQVNRQEYITVGKNVKLHVTDLGEGKPVVLIHGWPLSDAMYEYQYTALVEKGYRVIGITLRGFGLSDKPYGEYNNDVFADDIKSVLDQLNIQDATIGGYSMGGAVVIHYVSKYHGAHVNKLALFAAAAPSWTRRDDFQYGYWTKEDINKLIALNNTDRPQLMENFGKIFSADEHSVSPGMAAWLGIINWQASSYAMAQSLATLRDQDLRNDLKNIHIPTVIFQGRKDKIVSFDLAVQTNKLIKGSVLIPFEKSGHALFIEEKEKFNEELIKFIKN